MNALKPRTYVKNLTGVRAYLSLWIVLFHFNASSLLQIPLLQTVFYQGRLATDFFLILSGFVISYIYYDRMPEFRPAQYLQFLLKRFARLYPLHLLTFSIFAIFFIALKLTGHEPQNPDQFSFSSAVLNILMLHAWVPNAQLSWNFVSWSVSAEWFAVLVLFVFVITGWRKWNQIDRLGLITLLFALYVTHFADAWLPSRLIRMSFAFLYGAWLFHALPWFRGGSAKVWDFILAATILLIALIISTAAYEDKVAVIAPLWGLLIIGLFQAGRLSERVFANPFVMKLGEFSFSTYLIHGVLTKILFHLDASTSSYAGWLHFVSPYILMPLALTLTLILSYAVHLYFELPARDFVLNHGTRFLAAGDRLLQSFMNRSVNPVEKTAQIPR